MIFQAGIDLEIKDRDVQAIIDLDTGLIGFTERVADDSKEYHYSKSPIEFRIAFFEKIEALCVSKSHFNSKIYRKGKVANQLWDSIEENQ
ncbi:MAG: hypothetical protein GQ574_05940 [Crocinitomix sp.]|nr:hypothetical protein [Crocinitomix sp.]